ncbi:hypothetical protein [Clostridium thailandense]
MRASFGNQRSGTFLTNPLCKIVTNSVIIGAIMDTVKPAIATVIKIG